MVTVRTCVITGYGINADVELREAFERAGSAADRVHIGDLLADPAALQNYHIVAFPGGFSYGDHLGSGIVFAHLFRKHLGDALRRHIERGGLVIGICNGFQVLAKMGVLPGIDGGWEPTVSLIHNASGTFTDRWVKVVFNPRSNCVWTRGLVSMELPIRHGEGRFVVRDRQVQETLVRKNLIALQYDEGNPNGSILGIAGITDPTGRILGLMPHPEAFLFPENHPRWTREKIFEGEGLGIFRNGVRSVQDRFGS